MNASASGLDLSVVLTLMDDRGRTAECVSSWTRGQTFARERYEVIVATTGREPEVAARAQPALTPRDRLLTYAANNELALHNFGARAARGTWLLFTEAHCAARPDCLSELIAYLRENESELAGACVSTLGDGSAHPIARIEERWYGDGFAQWSRAGDWRKVTIRGTAVRRDCYVKVGGFKSEFGCFGEVLLAAELHAAGYRLGYAPKAAVKHYNGTDLHELLSYVREYRAGEVACQSQYATRSLAPYFGGTKTWGEASASERRLARRCALLSLRRAIRRPLRKGAPALAWAMVGELVKEIFHAATFGRAALMRAALSYAWNRALFAWPSRCEDVRYRRFCRLWEAAGDFARRQAVLEYRATNARRDTGTAPTLIYRPGVDPPGHLIGFHAPETFGGEPFRWSDRVALARVAVPAGDYEVEIDTNGVRDCNLPGLVQCFLDGRPLPRGRESSARRISFRADRSMFDAGPAQCLVLTSGRLRTLGSVERRTLGLPVFAIRFAPRAG